MFCVHHLQETKQSISISISDFQNKRPKHFPFCVNDFTVCDGDATKMRTFIW